MANKKNDQRPLPTSKNPGTSAKQLSEAIRTDQKIREAGDPDGTKEPLPPSVPSAVYHKASWNAAYRTAAMAYGSFVMPPDRYAPLIPEAVRKDVRRAVDENKPILFYGQVRSRKTLTAVGAALTYLWEMGADAPAGWKPIAGWLHPPDFWSIAKWDKLIDVVPVADVLVFENIGQGFLKTGWDLLASTLNVRFAHRAAGTFLTSRLRPDQFVGCEGAIAIREAILSRCVVIQLKREVVTEQEQIC